MKQILYMAIIATSGMTLFSHGLARIFKEKFLETVLLNQLVFPEKKEERENHPAGFVIHFGVGTFFSFLHYKFWKNTGFHPGILSGFATGFFNGLTGIAGWQAFFTLHPSPPCVKHKKFYAQLLAAHVVFGILNGIVFKSLHNGKG